MSVPRPPITDTLPPPSTSTVEEGKVPLYASQPTIRTAGDEEERQVTGRSRWRLISPLVYDGLGTDQKEWIEEFGSRKLFCMCGGGRGREWIVSRQWADDR
jgi:hypothetical protein